ncbi:AI-2E family transporter [Schlesneria sp. T3-172]|uniref:AI-2E family transporter n=1 Tax=Schlesneria sphaerica TaxID=3373610 RepID=UPI0037C83CEE
MSNSRSVPTIQRATVVLTGAVVTCIVVMALQWGRPVLIPIALAVLLTFLLNPIVTALNRRGIHRIASVVIAAGIAGVILFGIGWLLTTQVTGMLEELPRNTERIKAKVRALKEFGSGPTREHIAEMIQEISEELQLPANGKKTVPTSEQEGAPGPVVVTPGGESWFNYTEYLGSAFETLATLAFAFVLLMFFLIEREDLRDRIVLLAGRARLAGTSKAVEDITDRVSRYLGMVALVNGGFGVVLTIGLLLLGVPYAILWGFLAAALRFIPYIGPWVGAIFPIAMSFAMSDGLWQPMSVLAFVLVIELISNNVVEPLLFGHTIGVSATAMIISAAFWLFLWGPVGLVLSAPFAVCLVVLGKNVESLRFLYLLLGDKPALSADQSLYQRLMLGDEHEAKKLIEKRMKDADSVPDEIYDQLFVPALVYSNRDVQRGFLDEEEQEAIHTTMRECLNEVPLCVVNKEESEEESELQRESALSAPRARILACPGANESDVVVLTMLERLLDPLHFDVQIQSLETLSSELAAEVRGSAPAMIYIASTPPGGMGHAKYLCKRLHAAAPNVPIVVGRFGPKRSRAHDRQQLEMAGASFVVTSLVESKKLFQARLPVLICDHQSCPPGECSMTPETESTAVGATMLGAAAH